MIERKVDGEMERRSGNPDGVRAGFARVEILAAVDGADLVGYPTREGRSRQVRDPLFARALVLELGEQRIAFCTVDLAFISRQIAAAAAQRIGRETGISPDAVFVAASHTHSAPGPDDASCWPDGLDARIAESVAQACARLRPARIGAGWGMLHGHTLNRRHLEDPVDPAVFVVRVDDSDGKPLGVYYGFACHAVVLGPDTLEVTNDWVGACCDALEAALGPDAVAVYGPGGHGDSNPITDGVLARLAEASTVNVWIDGASLDDGIAYYGSEQATVGEFNIGDRRGGTFAEAEKLGRAVADEVLLVHRGIRPEEVTGLWSRTLTIRERLEPREQSAALWTEEDLRRFTDFEEPLEVGLVGIDGPGIVLAWQPGEFFAETGVSMRRALRAAGVRHPYAVGYTNGFRAYLPPARSFREGGYEIALAKALGIPETLQQEIESAVLVAVGERAG